jgi:hypothetical protein
LHLTHWKVRENVARLSSPDSGQDKRGKGEFQLHHFNVRRALAAAVKTNTDAQKMADDNVIFIAKWVERRIKADKNQLKAVGIASELVKDLSDRFAKAVRD